MCKQRAPRQACQNSGGGKPPGTARRCLCCGQDFVSEGQHNRVCAGCKTTSAWRAGDARDFSNGRQCGAIIMKGMEHA